MSVEFFKYQATGNDFVMIDDRKSLFPSNHVSLITSLCNRRFGIGSDGLILLRNSTEASFEMVFYNPDASMSFCGNGSRCAVLFAKHLGIISNECSFKAIDGIHKASIQKDTITIHMNPVTQVNQLNDSEFFIHTGSPHFIRYVKSVDQVNIIDESTVIRYSDAYKPGGTNVNFVEETSNGISMRTYERGVEDETLSCGTGVTAAGISYLRKQKIEGTVQVTTRGGKLEVSARKKEQGFDQITLTGPAQMVFKGTYEG